MPDYSFEFGGDSVVDVGCWDSLFIREISLFSTPSPNEIEKPSENIR